MIYSFTIVFVLFVVILIFVLLTCKENFRSFVRNEEYILTMTATMGFHNRFQYVVDIIKSLQQKNTFKSCLFVIINEWTSDQDSSFFTAYMAENFPDIHFIQKNRNDQGQARSLNILIRDYLLDGRYKYWIHWEDTWLCKKTFFPELIETMNENKDIVQLQLTADWLDDVSPKHQLERGNNIVVLIPQTKHLKSIFEIDNINVDTWPLFSLRPSINRLSFYQQNTQDFYFIEDPHQWPLRFEWEFGRIFLRNKGVKAVVKSHYAERVKGYKSTYQNG